MATSAYGKPYYLLCKIRFGRKKTLKKLDSGEKECNAPFREKLFHGGVYMYTFSVAGQEDRCFQVRPPVVAFAGSRRGSLPESVTLPLAHAFHAVDFSLITGCAPGIDACFRRASRHFGGTARALTGCRPGRFTQGRL